MAVFFCWVLFSFLVGAIGSNRSIGFWGAFLASLLLSPIIGAIIALLSKDNDTAAYEAKVLHTQQQQAASLQQIKERAPAVVATKTISEELESLQKMKEAGHLTDDEFQQAKTRVLSGAQ